MIIVDVLFFYSPTSTVPQALNIYDCNSV